MIEDIVEAGKAIGGTVSAGAGTVGAVVDTVAAIAGKIEQWTRLRAETSSVIRLLYLEVCKDLELLSLLSDERGLKWGDPRLRFLIRGFETGVMELVLMGKEKEEVYQKLAAKGRIQDRPETPGRSRQALHYENVLQAIRFIYVKMDLLRKLDSGSGVDAFTERLKAAERLRNIEARLVLVKRILGELEDNKGIA